MKIFVRLCMNKPNRPAEADGARNTYEEVNPLDISVKLLVFGLCSKLCVRTYPYGQQNTSEKTFSLEPLHAHITSGQSCQLNSKYATSIGKESIR